NNNAAISACDGSMTAQTVVAKASPTLTASVPSAVTAGDVISAASITATLASSSGTTDTNAIVFSVFCPQTLAPTTCTPNTNGWTTVGTATPAGNGTYPSSA